MQGNTNCTRRCLPIKVCSTPGRNDFYYLWHTILCMDIDDNNEITAYDDDDDDEDPCTYCEM